MFDREANGSAHAGRRGFVTKVIVPFCAALALVAGRAAAAEPITLFGYDLSITLQGATASAYQGSKHYSGFPSVSFAVTRPWTYDDFGAPDDSASVTLLTLSNVSAGAAASIIANRGNSHALRGMDNIGWAGEGGGFVNWWPAPWMRVRVEALRGLFAEDGLLVNTGSDFVTHQGRFTLSAGPRFSWADGHYNGTYFGITPAEAAAGPHLHSAYIANAGPLTGGLEAAVEYKWFDRWRLNLNANYDRLLGQDAQSPLVRITGSPNQFSVAGGVRFMLSD